MDPVVALQQVALEAFGVLRLASIADMGMCVDATDSTEATSECLAIDTWRGGFLRSYTALMILTC